MSISRIPASQFQTAPLTRPRFSGAAQRISAPAPTPVMHDFIDLGSYTEEEQKHAGWVLSNAIQRTLLTQPMIDLGALQTTDNPRIIEIGSSSGTSTLPMVRHLERIGHDFERLDAIDIDDEAIAILQKKLAELANSDSRVTGAVADAMRYHAPDGKPYSHAVMQFSLSHFDADGKSYLLDHLWNIVSVNSRFTPGPERTTIDQLRKDAVKYKKALQPHGFIIITDEFLPRFSDQASEWRALWRHHGAVIFDALIKGNFKLAELELEALYSGLHRTGDFKVSCEAFEDLLWEKGFVFKKYKTFPLASDLIPAEPGTSLEAKTPPERHSILLWNQLSGKILEAAQKPPEGKSKQLPQEAREELQALAGLFRKLGLDTLRETLSPEDIETLTEQELARYHEYTPSSAKATEDWGVYTYQMIKHPRLSWEKKQQNLVSLFFQKAYTPEENAARLRHFEGDDEKSLMYLLFIPSNRWWTALGESRPSYLELQKPETARQWKEKVDFTKTCIRRYLASVGMDLSANLHGKNVYQAENPID